MVLSATTETVINCIEGQAAAKAQAGSVSWFCSGENAGKRNTARHGTARHSTARHGATRTRAGTKKETTITGTRRLVFPAGDSVAAVQSSGQQR